MRIIQTNQKIYSSMYLSMPNANIFSQLANEKKNLHFELASNSLNGQSTIFTFDNNLQNVEH